MKENILAFLKSDCHNFHTSVEIELKFGQCSDILVELVKEGLIIRNEGLNYEVFKYRIK